MVFKNFLFENLGAKCDAVIHIKAEFYKNQKINNQGY